jgi:hypothetical protein
MLDLQSCTASVQDLPGLSDERFPASSDGARNFSNRKVEGDIVVIEDGFTAVTEEMSHCITQGEIPDDTTFPDMKSEPEEVSNVCVCLLLEPFYHCSEMSVVFVMSVFLFN